MTVKFMLAFLLSASLKIYRKRKECGEHAQRSLSNKQASYKQDLICNTYRVNLLGYYSA